MKIMKKGTCQKRFGENNENQNNKTTTVKKGQIMIDVTGEVCNPGVVILNEGARIIDAIKAAGGKTEEADTSMINLAYVLEDGVQLYIPKIGEKAKNIGQINNNNQSKSEMPNASEVSQSNNEEQLADEESKYIRTGAGEGIITEEVATGNTNKNTKVNINTANIERLEALSGIGASTAQKIIEYREKNGKFQTIEDIKKVSGIGESKFNNIKDKITVK